MSKDIAKISVQKSNESNVCKVPDAKEANRLSIQIELEKIYVESDKRIIDTINTRDDFYSPLKYLGMEGATRASLGF